MHEECDVWIYSLSNCTGELKRRRTSFLQQDSESPDRVEIQLFSPEQKQNESYRYTFFCKTLSGVYNIF